MRLLTFLRLLKRLKAPLIIRKVQGHSMLPALAPGDYVVGLRYGMPLRLNRIVIFEHENKEKIKRVTELRHKDIYVMGDNPSASTDSRSFGWIARDCVVAQLIWPRNI